MSKMSEAEARDAYVVVVVEAVNNRGQKVTLRGKPLPFGAARKMIVQSAEYIAGGDPKKTLIPMLEDFCTLTGITDKEIEAAELGLAAMIGVANGFFYHTPTVPAAAGNGTPAPATPSPT